MKRFLMLLFAIVACVVACYGEELPKQLIEIENAGGIAIIQKQPSNNSQLQVINIKKSGGLLLIQINGKVKDTTADKVE